MNTVGINRMEIPAVLPVLSLGAMIALDRKGFLKGDYYKRNISI
jgi:hypothetical protein